MGKYDNADDMTADAPVGGNGNFKKRNVDAELLTGDAEKIREYENNAGKLCEVFEEEHDARLVGYMELGLHPQLDDNGNQKVFEDSGRPFPDAKRMRLTFEFPDVKFDFGGTMGEKCLQLTVEEVMGNGQRNRLKRYFQALRRCEGAAEMTNFAQMADATIPCVIKLTLKKAFKGDEPWVYANIRMPEDVMPAVETRREGKKKVKAFYEVTKAEYEPLIFMFNDDDLAMWDRVSDYFKKRIKKAADFAGSPIEALLAARGDQGATEQETQAAQAEDESGVGSDRAMSADDMDDIPF